LAATVTIPLASMLNGPVVNGVTLVLVVVAAMLLNVICQCVQCRLLYCLMQRLPMDRYCIDTGLFTTTVRSGITICWLTFNPVDGLASHIGR
jgi:hypothetical protein